ncbi:hypothetical protein AVEN_95572-1 [Araneus ventricosus]|uniref:Uncharacterized protein n=1 Tax=Araneus ventricosus TaxID=182803 RepID=A0A4Y2PF89_ARAVE|nr:hypothetical protein AVEN_95572-1 [Araneus ventricosus]
MFPLCRSCVETNQQTPCSHNDEERPWRAHGSAKRSSWQRRKDIRSLIYKRSIIFPTTSDSLFRTYIDTFLIRKQESSEWPQNCSTEEKATYIREYEEKEGIKLNAQNISKNPGQRQAVRLALNSAWGK